MSEHQEYEPADPEADRMRGELEEAQRAIRALLRQLSKEQTRHRETTRAYNMTVSNLREMSHERVTLERERDQWRARAAGTPGRLDISLPLPPLTPEEAGAIRKAMARLHHPGQGGDGERLKLWEAILDPTER